MDGMGARRSEINHDLALLFGHDYFLMEEITQAVSEETGIPVEDIKSIKRTQDIARARQYCFYRARQHGFTLSQIANEFNRDHTSVLHGVRRIKELLSEAGSEGGNATITQNAKRS